MYIWINTDVLRSVGKGGRWTDAWDPTGTAMSGKISLRKRDAAPIVVVCMLEDLLQVSCTRSEITIMFNEKLLCVVNS